MTSKNDFPISCSACRTNSRAGFDGSWRPKYSAAAASASATSFSERSSLEAPCVSVVESALLPSVVVINAAPVQGVETAEAKAAIAAAGVAVAPVILHNRKSFVSRFHEGLTALDIDPKGKAADETRAFLLWVCDQVTLLPNKQVTEVATWPANASL